MKSKVHIIIAADDCCSRSLGLSKKRLSVMVLVAVLLGGVAVTATMFSAYTLVMQPERKQHLAELTTQVQLLEGQNSNLLAQVDEQQREKQQLMSEALSHLNERTAQLESILTQVGVVVPTENSVVDAGTVVADQTALASSGGPFIFAGEDNYEGLTGQDETGDVLKHSDKLLDLITHVPLGRPTAGYCSSGFGRRTDPINGRRAFHSGIDIASNVGTKIYATADGVVVSCGRVNGYGKMIKLNNGQRFSTVFGHLHKIMVAKGAQVKRGDLLGTMGSTGRSTGPHLHYEIRDLGHAVNPYSFTFL